MLQVCVARKTNHSLTESVRKCAIRSHKLIGVATFWKLGRHFCFQSLRLPTEQFRFSFQRGVTICLSGAIYLFSFIVCYSIVWHHFASSRRCYFPFLLFAVHSSKAQLGTYHVMPFVSGPITSFSISTVAAPPKPYICWLWHQLFAMGFSLVNLWGYSCICTSI